MSDDEIQPGDLLRVDLGDGAVHHLIVAETRPGGPDEQHIELIPDPFDQQGDWKRE